MNDKNTVDPTTHDPAVRGLIDMLTPLSPVIAGAFATLTGEPDDAAKAQAARSLRTLVQHHLSRLPQAQRLSFSLGLAALLRPMPTSAQRDALAALGALALGRSEADARRHLLEAIEALEGGAARQGSAA